MINAVMLGAIAGCGKLPIPAEAFEAAIRADGKAVEANLRGFNAGLGGGARRRGTCARPKRSARAARHDSPRSSSEIASMPAAAQDMIAKACAGSPPTRTSITRGSISTGLRASGRRRARRRDGKLLPRPHGTSRCACPTRTSFASRRRRSIRRACAHRKGTRREAGRALQDRRVSQARHRGNLPGPAAVLARRVLWRSERRGWLDQVSGAWMNDHLGHRLSALPHARQAETLAATQLPLQGRASGDRELAAHDRRRPRKCRPSSRSRSPNVRG